MSGHQFVSGWSVFMHSHRCTVSYSQGESNCSTRKLVPSSFADSLFLRFCSHIFDSAPFHGNSRSGVPVFRIRLFCLKACAIQRLVSVLFGIKYIDCGHESQPHAKLCWFLSGKPIFLLET